MEKEVIVAVDVDDVVADLTGAWVKKYNRKYRDNLQREAITDWNVSKFVVPECGEKVFEYFESKTLYNSIKPVKDSLEGVNLLKTLSRVIFVTCPTIGTAGRKYLWLKEHGYIDDLTDYIEAKDKSLVKYTYIIDDKYDNVKHNNLNLLFNQPWNRKYSYPNRVNSWREIINLRGGL